MKSWSLNPNLTIFGLNRTIKTSTQTCNVCGLMFFHRNVTSITHGYFKNEMIAKVRISFFEMPMLF